MLKEVEREEDYSRFRPRVSLLMLVGWLVGRLSCARLEKEAKGTDTETREFKLEKGKLFPQAGRVGNGPGCPGRLCSLRAQSFTAQPE